MIRFIALIAASDAIGTSLAFEGNMPLGLRMGALLFGAIIFAEYAMRERGRVA